MQTWSMRCSRRRSIKCARFSSFVRFAPIPLVYHHNERVVIHVQPIRATDKLVIRISNEWAIKIDRQVGLIEPSHWLVSTFCGLKLGWNDISNLCGNEMLIAS